MALLAGFKALLSRYTGQSDVLVGSGFANRLEPGSERAIGMLVNTVLLRTRVHAEYSFRELLEHVRLTCLDAYANQRLPVNRIVEELRIPREAARNPLIQLMFTSHETPIQLTPPNELEFELVEALNGGAANLDLNVLAIPGGDSAADCTLVWEFATDLFDASTISRMAAHYLQLLHAVIKDPAQSIDELSLLEGGERERLLEWGRNVRLYPRERTIHSLFAEEAAESPEATALKCGDWQISYAKLERRANRLARLLQSRGVGAADVVGVCLERSADLVISFLAILKLGAAYLPLDPDFPLERLGFMLQDSGAKLVIRLGDLADRIAPIAERVCLDACARELMAQSAQPISAEHDAQQPAYIMYTSGSTGTPKGAVVTHRGVVRLVKSADYVHLGPSETHLLLAPAAFDVSTFEIWGPLLNGGCLALFRPGPVSLADLSSCIRAENVTTLWLTSGLFHELVDYDPSAFAGVRQLLAGGDVVSARHVRALARAVPTCTIINGYGPTENTVFTACYTVKDAQTLGSSVPIGRPIGNTSVYVLDDRQQLVPIGVPGELCTGGDGVALGYLHAPELSAERFLPDRFDNGPDARMYRTGDRARWLADGNLEFLGRFDQQLKVRGFRVEPAEIEACLELHPDVCECAVLGQLVRGHRRLVAYVVCDTKTAVDDHELRSHVRGHLPEHMVPSVFVHIPKLPLTHNGKLDRGALPPVDGMRSSSSFAINTAVDELESRMARLWAEVLGVSSVGLDDNFFEVGGHSLLAVRLFGRIEREFGVQLPLASLFPDGTVRQLAALVRHGPKSSDGASRLVSLNRATHGAPLFLVHPLDGDVLRFSRLGQLLADRGVPVYGLRARGLSPGEEPTRSIELIAREYAGLVQARADKGVYRLAGFSSGGVIALELARQLQARGGSIAFLGLLDTRCPIPEHLPRWTRAAQLGRDLAAHCHYAAQPGQRTALLRRQLAQLAGVLRSERDGWSELERQQLDEIGMVSALHLHVARAHWRALLEYQGSPYMGPVHLFRTRVQLLLSDHDPLLGWSALLPFVQMASVPGRHEDIFKLPYVRTLADRLLAALGT